MAWFPKSIRWRFQVWFAFLLACVLVGFGVSAYELLVANQNHQIYEQLQQHLSAIASDLSRNGSGIRGRRDHDHDRDHDRDRIRDGDFRRGPRPQPPEEFAVAKTNSGAMPPGEPCHTNAVTETSRPPETSLRAMMAGGREATADQLSREVLSLFDQNDPRGFYYVVWNHDGAERLRSANVPAGVEITPPVRRTSGPQLRVRGEFQESFLQHSLGHRILVGRSIAIELDHRRTYALWLTAAGSAILIVGLCGSWRLANRSLRPVADMSAAASRIARGNLSERINKAETDDELGQLAGTLNSTFTRLESAFAQQKQFTADAAHELRTPLAVMISEAQTTLARPRSAAEYRETIEACLDTAQQMRRLTESLLELARFDADRESIQRQPFDLAAVARSCIALVHPLADSRALKIQTDLSPVLAFGDADLVSRVITNLLTNAVYYNKADGEIRLKTSVMDGQAILAVSDTGLGIGPEDLPHVFERFYRADKSRVRADGRYGLGLAICKPIVDAHGGRIEVQSQVDQGSTFTVRLPLAPAS